MVQQANKKSLVNSKAKKKKKSSYKKYNFLLCLILKFFLFYFFFTLPGLTANKEEWTARICLQCRVPTPIHTRPFMSGEKDKRDPIFIKKTKLHGVATKNHTRPFRPDETFKGNPTPKIREKKCESPP